jgi:hypothetical protein
LFCQADVLVTVNAQPMDRSAGIPLGAHVEAGNLSFVVTRG